jgi:hypothetical protein
LRQIEPAPHTNFEIVTLSNRADLISGGNALVEVRVPKTVLRSPGGRSRKHPEVSVEAAQSGRVCPNRLLFWAVGTLGSRVSGGVPLPPAPVSER